jgi:hypothetical protein
MLICLGATLYFLRLRNPEALERFLRLATLNRAYGTLDMAFGRRRGHRNEPKHIGRTTLLPIHLPRGAYDLISAYSAATGRSRNALLSGFLETGYVLYMLGQDTLLKTLRSLEDECRHPQQEQATN